MKKMRYFQSYFSKNDTEIDELDISVHCDGYVFEWLIRYLLDPSLPKIELHNVISVLISSDFLGIDDLVEKCLVFVSNHLEEVVKMPIDMGCLNSSLTDRLSLKVGLTELATFKDPKDKLASKLYQKKLTELVQDDCITDEASQLRMCVNCQKLFTRASQEWSLCAKARVFIDVHGEQIA